MRADHAVLGLISGELAVNVETAARTVSTPAGGGACAPLVQRTKAEQIVADVFNQPMSIRTLNSSIVNRE